MEVLIGSRFVVRGRKCTVVAFWSRYTVKVQFDDDHSREVVYIDDLDLMRGI
jgi:hypothetical protein